jgi:hypothetical protein
MITWLDCIINSNDITQAEEFGETFMCSTDFKENIKHSIANKICSNNKDINVNMYVRYIIYDKNIDKYIDIINNQIHTSVSHSIEL